MHRFRAVLMISLLAGIGCTTYGELYAVCANPDFSHRDADGDPDPCGGIGAYCAGGCLRPGQDGWSSQPVFVWMGAEAGAPGCPDGAPEWKWTGYAGRTPPIECGACRCEPPAGTCELPIDFTGNAATCEALQPSTQTYSFDAPSAWDGSCTPANAVAMGVQSLSIEAMKINQTGCAEAVDPTPALFAEPPAWETFAMACHGQPGASGCGDSGYFCANLGPRDGFRQCVWRDDSGAAESKCPEPYTDRFDFYQKYEDNRTCAPCVCGTPTGSTCTAQISVYSNDMCSGNPLEEWTQMNDAPCKNLAPGSALRSKQASAPMYTPGRCEPFGGNPIGSVVGREPVSVCCMP